MKQWMTCIVLGCGLLSTGGVGGGVGCSDKTRIDQGAYTTVIPEPRRDTTLAHRLNQQAADLLDEGRFEESVPVLEEALDADVAFGPAHNNLGKAYFGLGDYYRSAWEYRYAIKLMPHHPEPRNNLGLVLERTGRIQDAVVEYEAAVKIAPDKPVLLGNLIRARIRQGDHGQEVVELLERLVASETRPQWRTWAEEQLVLMRAKRPTVTIDQGEPFDSGSAGD